MDSRLVLPWLLVQVVLPVSIVIALACLRLQDLVLADFIVLMGRIPLSKCCVPEVRIVPPLLALQHHALLAISRPILV